MGWEDGPGADEAMLDFSGKVAVVTGGASGIGRATVTTLASLGARVVVADVNVDRAETVAQEIASAGGVASACGVDVFFEDQIEAALEFAVRTYGGLDVLHNCAGIPRTIAPDAEVANLTAEQWHKTISGHLTSSMLACKHAIPRMQARGGGAIVNTASVAGYFATIDLASYSAAKAGVIALTREVATSYGRDSIRCNCVAPGPVMTPRGMATFTPAMLEGFASEIPLPRFAEAQDLANVVVFLASDMAGMVNGQTVVVDGGYTIKMPGLGARDVLSSARRQEQRQERGK